MIAAAAWLIAAEAWAHRDRGPDDPCRRQIGSSVLHLTLYQPQFDPVGEYCEEAPRPGATVVVVDVTDGELRRTPIGLEVVESGASTAPETILRLSPEIRRSGSMSGEALLKDGADYRLRVVVGGEGAEPLVLSFPVRVAPWWAAIVGPAAAVAGLVLFIAVSVARFHVASRRQPSLST